MYFALTLHFKPLIHHKTCSKGPAWALSQAERQCHHWLMAPTTMEWTEWSIFLFWLTVCYSFADCKMVTQNNYNAVWTLQQCSLTKLTQEFGCITRLQIMADKNHIWGHVWPQCHRATTPSSPSCHGGAWWMHSALMTEYWHSLYCFHSLFLKTLG